MIVLVTENSYCQKIFRDGYIIKKTGETFNGLIEYSPNQKIPSQCVFKRFDIAVTIPYSPADIHAFGYINGKRYESKNQNKKDVFYEVLVLGRINLYYKGSKYFIEEENQGMTEIKDGSISYSTAGERKEFKSLAEFLRYITKGEVENINDKVNIKNDLVAIITDYNRRSGNSFSVFNRTITERELTRAVIKSGAYKNRFGMFAGINYYSLTLVPTKSFYIPAPGISGSPVAGISWERQIFPKSDRLTVRIDLMFLKNNFYSYSERTPNYGYLTRDDAFFDFSGIKLPLLLQYSFTGGRIVPYINAGLSYTAIIQKNYLHIQEEENSSNNVIVTSQDRNMVFRKNETSLLCGTGVRFRLFSNTSINLQGRVELGKGLFNNSDNLNFFKQHSVQTSFLLGFTF
jgi:hypothetical protein